MNKSYPNWEYMVVDNFFSADIYNNLISCFNRIQGIKIPADKQLQCVYSNYIRTGYIPKQEPGLKEEMYDSTLSLEEKEKLIIDIIQCLKQARNEKESFITNALRFYRPEIDIQRYTKGYHYALVSSGVDFKYQWHTDSIWKRISVVVYMEPENVGTELSLSHLEHAEKEINNYCGGGVFESETITWKSNRALIFCTKEDTFHRYISNSRTNRNTIVINYGRDVLSEERSYK